MEVTDPSTGIPVTVRMRRDLPGYNVTRARRNSPRLRWSLPVDIEWQSECIMKFLGQNCACCDLISGPQDDGKAANVAIKPPSGRPGGFGGGHEKVFVDSKMSKVSKSTVGGESNGKPFESSLLNDMDANISKQGNVRITQTQTSVMTSQSEDDVTLRLSPLALDAFPGFPLPAPNGGQRRNRRRKQLISTSDMLIAQPKIQEEELVEVTKKLSPFDVMQSNLLPMPPSYSDVIEQEVTSHTIPPLLPDIAEEDGGSGLEDAKEES